MRRDKARIFDEYLAAAARTGDRDAFDRLAQRWQPRLLRHAYRLSGDSDAARDIVQDAWADIVKGLPSLTDANVFPAWAYRIVTRRAADSIRKAQQRRKTTSAFAAEPAPEAPSAAIFENAVNAGPLAAALAALPPDQRAAIGLFYQEEFSVAEIAAALKVPAGTIKTRLMHARRKLRAALEERKSNV